MAKKPEEICVGDYPFYCWRYEEQTEVKHNVIYEYIDCWIKILGKYNKLNYFDCYGGCGAYVDKDSNIFYGSPIETAKIINKNHISLDRDVNLVVIEKSGQVLDNLKKVFTHIVPEAKPIYINENFDKAINDLLDELEGKGSTLAPTFFFVDPFGYSIKMDTIKRIMNVPKSEVLINFMFNFINRSINIPSEADRLNMLFGTSKWEEIRPKTGADREDSIINLYKKQTKMFSNYSYAYKLKFPDQNRTYYYLVHLTNHFKGCNIMKSAFAKHNSGRLEYSGNKGKDLSFFDLPEYKEDLITNFFRNPSWKNKSLSFDEIIAIIIDDTPFIEKDIRTALKTMIKNGEIIRIPVTSKPNGTGLSKADTIEFKENPNGKH